MSRNLSSSAGGQIFGSRHSLQIFIFLEEARQKACLDAISSVQSAVMNTPKEYFQQEAFWEAFRHVDGWTISEKDF